MKIVIAMDSFKGSLSSEEAGCAVKEGIIRRFPDAEISLTPIADGGEGTSRAIISAAGGKIESATVHDPLGRIVLAEYGLLNDGTAVIEMAAASGITLLSEKLRNPLYTSSRGTGELILAAIRQGARRFVIGIGGSATNDGGMGMLRALGYEFLDATDKPVKEGAIGLKDLKKIKCDKVIKELSECEFTVACDVKNPLVGEFGASRTYGPQKGATPDMVEYMDSWLKAYAEIVKELFGKDFSQMEGAGAAGGMGFAFTAFLRTQLQSGIETVIKTTHLEEKIKDATAVITGEGRLDGQSPMGKAVSGIASIAKKYNKPTFALAGCVEDDARLLNKAGVDAYFPIIKAPCRLYEAMKKENAYKNLADTAEQLAGVLMLINS